MNTSSRPSRLPSLPIIDAPAPGGASGRSTGSMLYLGTAGLVVVWPWWAGSAIGFWTIRDIWARVYVLHDAKATDEARLQAAFALSRDPRVEQRQLWEMSLRRGLPELAGYILAEGIGAGLVAEDPQGYVSAVALSPDWPSWLRLVLTRPMAYAATAGHAISRETLAELCRKDDPIIRLWALYALAVQASPDPQTMVMIEKASQDGGPSKSWPTCSSPPSRRTRRGGPRSSTATAWNRRHHPEASRLWQGWTDPGREGSSHRSPGD